MPIISKDSNGNVTREHEGRVLKIRTYVDTRNHSDTLDYSDFRSTNVTEALVYIGRTIEAEREGETRAYLPGVGYCDVGAEIPVERRFAWVDCTNLFVWRGSPERTPRLDELALLDGQLIQDFEVWTAHNEAVTAKRDAEAAKRSAEAKARKEEEERNRPVKGKPMVVFKGRKVPVGTRGVVAFVSDSGRVLLKAAHEWQNRQTNGTWVEARNLRAE